MAIPGFDPDFLKEQIDSVRESIGRDVTIYTPKEDTCVLCVASGYYDPISDTSFNVVCPQCNGAYWITSVEATTVLARIHWVGNEAVNLSPAGKYFTGEATITVDPDYTELLEAAQSDSGKVVVDGQDMEIIRINPMGAPQINRVRAVLRGMGNRPDHG